MVVSGNLSTPEILSSHMERQQKHWKKANQTDWTYIFNMSFEIQIRVKSWIIDGVHKFFPPLVFTFIRISRSEVLICVPVIRDTWGLSLTFLCPGLCRCLRMHGKSDMCGNVTLLLFISHLLLCLLWVFLLYISFCFIQNCSPLLLVLSFFCDVLSLCHAPTLRDLLLFTCSCFHLLLSFFIVSPLPPSPLFSLSLWLIP